MSRHSERDSQILSVIPCLFVMRELIPSPQEKQTSGAPRVLVATTAMLAFISFWRAAAIVLNDMGSSAFYAGAIAEHFVGKAGPWFILAIMLLAYAVRSVYIESCSMFVRGGVYRVVKEAMGSTLAKFSVSALMFDYILTGPISGVSAGLYLVGLLNELLHYAHYQYVLPVNATAAVFAIAGHDLFLVGEHQGHPRVERKSSAHHVRDHRDGGDHARVVRIHAGVRGAHLPPLPTLKTLTFSPDALGWLRYTSLPYTIGLIGILIGLGHSVLAMSGEETMAQVYREIEHPKLRNLEKAGFVIFVYSLIFTAGVAFFAVMIIPDSVRQNFFDNPIGGLAMYLTGPLLLRLAFRAFVVIVGVLMLAGAVNTAIVGSNGVLNRVSEDGILPDWFRRPHRRFGTSYRILNLVVGLQLLTIILSRGNIFVLGEAYAFGVMWSFAMKGLAVLVLRYKQPGQREFRVPLNFKIGERGDSRGAGADHAGAGGAVRRQSVHEAGGHDFGRRLYHRVFHGIRAVGKDHAEARRGARRTGSVQPGGGSGTKSGSRGRAARQCAGDGAQLQHPLSPELDSVQNEHAEAGYNGAPSAAAGTSRVGRTRTGSGAAF